MRIQRGLPSPETKLEHCIDLPIGAEIPDFNGEIFKHTHVRRNSVSLEFHFRTLGISDVKQAGYALWKGASSRFPSLAAFLKPPFHSQLSAAMLKLVNPETATVPVLTGEAVMTADQLASKYAPLGEHPALPKSIWIEEVNRGATLSGYWAWVRREIEVAATVRASTIKRSNNT